MDEELRKIIHREPDFCCGVLCVPLSQQDKDHFAHYRSVCKRYNIRPGTASKLELEFVERVTDAEFFVDTPHV